MKLRLRDKVALFSSCISILAVGTGCGFQASKTPSPSPTSIVLKSGAGQQFSIAPLLGGTLWLVNNQLGGSSAVGTISPTGVYLAPVIPPPMPVIVTAESGYFPATSASATVEVVNPAPQVS